MLGHGIIGVKIGYMLCYQGRLNGLFLCDKLDDTKGFDVDPKLLEEEKRLQFIEKSLIDFVNKYKPNK